MRPLLICASSACIFPKSRRVIHLEFSVTELATSRIGVMRQDLVVCSCGES